MKKSVMDSISNEAVEAYQNLSGKFKQDIDDYLRNNPYKHLYNRHDVINAYLDWNNILGYTRNLDKLIELAHLIELVTTCMKGSKEWN